MPAPGERAKLTNLLDNQMADDIQPLYSIELSLAKSPEKGVKCGGIVVFKLNQTELDLNPDHVSEEDIAKMQQLAGEQTQTVHRDLELFRETDGRWIPWAIDRMFELFDRYSGNANFAIACPALQAHERISKKRIVSMRSNPRELFKTAFKIDTLLSKGFAFDPWGGKVRRGRIRARFHRK